MAEAALRGRSNFPRFAGAGRYDGRAFLFFLALAVYALSGEPTPDALRWPEALIGILLLLAAGCPGALGTLKFSAPGPLWQNSGRVLLFFGLSVPLVSGLMLGNSFSLMMRDLVPFLFMLLPLFLVPYAGEKFSNGLYPLSAALFVGVMFSVRSLLPAITAFFSGGGHFAALPRLTSTDTAYLANAPTVLFAALWLLGMAGLKLWRGLSAANMAGALLCLGVALFPLAAMALVIQRASLGMIALGLSFLLILALFYAPRRAAAPLLMAVTLIALFWPVLAMAVDLVSNKTALVGLNMRAQEAVTVLERIGASPLGLLFGAGWGGTFESPAVGGLTVNFTHSLLTSCLLKTGIIGLLLALCYLAAIAERLYRLFYRQPVLAAALAAPFVVDVFLYASFKSLDFGLILLLICLWADGGDALKEGARYST